MKNKLLFSTALVAASMSFAATANAFVGGILVDEFLGDSNWDDGEYYIAGGTGEMTQDVTALGQTTLDFRTKLVGDKTLTVNGYLTETEAGSDVSGIKVEINKATSGEYNGYGAMMLGNNLTVGDVDMSDGAHIRLWVSNVAAGNPSPVDGHTVGLYANNPNKTLTVNGTLNLTGDRQINQSKNLDETDDADEKTALQDLADASNLTFNGSGRIVNAGTLTMKQKTTFNIDVEGTGALIANADVINNAIIANDVTINADKAFENNGTLSGAVTNAGTLDSAFTGLTGTVINSGTLNLANGGTLTNIITNTGTVNMSGNFALGEDVTLGGTNNVDGTLDLGDNKLTGNVTLADGSALAFNWNEGKVEGTVTLAGKADLKATVASGTEDGEYTFASSVNPGAEGAGWNEVNNSLYNITLNDGNNTMTIEKKSSSEVAESTGADANQAAAISAVIDGANTGNAAFDNVANNISEMLQSGDDAQVQAALDLVTAMSPEAAPMVASVSTENVAQVFSAIANRLSSGALATANQGMSSGDSLLERGAAWVQGLFNHAKLDKTANNDGFKADTAGLALGFEKQVSDETKVGLGYAYNNSDVKSAMRKTDVDTHSVFAYGEYKPSNWFVNGMLSHSWSRYDEKTPVSTAKHDAETLGLQMMTGYNMLMGNVTVTPEAGLRYVHVDQDAYTTSLGANVGGDKSDILTGVMGVNVAKNWNLDNGMTLKPEARLALTYDIKHDAANSTVLLPNGSSYTVEGKALDRFGVEAGLGLAAEINDNVELSVGYEGKFRDDYRDHTGLLNLKYKF